jgi:hypothetical protein
MKKTSAFALILLGIIATYSLNDLSDNKLNQNAYAHNFAPNESAEFLALMQLIKTEANIVKSNLNNNNTELAEEHANRAQMILTPFIVSEVAERNERVANELNSSLMALKESATGTQQPSATIATADEINAIIDEAITVRIDPEQRNNATIQAIAFADILDGILNNYGDAYAVGFDMTNMTNMMMRMDTGEEAMDMGTDMSQTGMDTDTSVRNESNMSGMNMTGMGMDMQSGDIVNMTAYQTANALASIAPTIFKNDILPLAPERSTNFISNLESALTELKVASGNMTSPMEIMNIVHGKVHPNLQTAFALPTRQ